MHLLYSQAQNRTTYYAPNQLAQMRPNPRWQQQGGRGQGKARAASIFTVMFESSHDISLINGNQPNVMSCT